MKFIKKDVNRRLLVIVLVLLALFISSTVYYEVSLKSLVSRYNREQQIFGALTADAVVEELNKSFSLRQTITKYREHLETRFDEISVLNEQLKSERDRLQNELALVKSQIEYQRASSLGATSQFVLFQSKIQEISSLNRKIEELCARLNAYNISDNNCQGAGKG